MLLQCVPPYRRGAIMGLDSSINTVARIVAMPLLGSLYKSSGPGVCFGVSSLFLVASAFVTVLRRVVVLRGL